MSIKNPFLNLAICSASFALTLSHKTLLFWKFEKKDIDFFVIILPLDKSLSVRCGAIGRVQVDSENWRNVFWQNHWYHCYTRSFTNALNRCCLFISYNFITSDNALGRCYYIVLAVSIAELLKSYLYSNVNYEKR